MEWFGGVLAGQAQTRVKKERTVYASDLATRKQTTVGSNQEGLGSENRTSSSSERYRSSSNNNHSNTSRPTPSLTAQLSAPPAVQQSSQLTIAAPPSVAQPSIQQPRQVKKKKTKKKPRPTNILVLGKQHAGKSAFINTFRRAITGDEFWSTAPVGRLISRGTSSYEPYAGGDLVLVDTAGRKFEPKISTQETELYTKMHAGMPWKTDLIVEEEWNNSEVIPENAIDHVVFVVPATDIITDLGPFHILKRYETSLARCNYIPSRFSWWESKLGNAPFVVVTNIDKLEDWTWSMTSTIIKKIKNELGKIVHKNRVFCITNPDSPQDISELTERTLSSLNVSLRNDILVRSTALLKNRNSKWKSEVSESSEEEEEEEPLPRQSTHFSSVGGGDDDVVELPVHKAEVVVTTPVQSPLHADGGSLAAEIQRRNAELTGNGALMWSMAAAPPPPNRPAKLY
eukprot:TRINITY_DN875_c1_g2_i1.p1 TRINITY_DN875_c1_g2~~TRINITY_DN875_c1_g2_i1.p1  ORF type:complete len:456 (+),score=95.29 TRINITY_DN875_c1_g2_i1:45-1412(+)